MSKNRDKDHIAAQCWAKQCGALACKKNCSWLLLAASPFLQGASKMVRTVIRSTGGKAAVRPTGGAAAADTLKTRLQGASRPPRATPRTTLTDGELSELVAGTAEEAAGGSDARTRAVMAAAAQVVVSPFPLAI